VLSKPLKFNGLRAFYNFLSVKLGEKCLGAMVWFKEKARQKNNGYPFQKVNKKYKGYWASAGRLGIMFHVKHFLSSNKIVSRETFLSRPERACKITFKTVLKQRSDPPLRHL
jgi:hypothetical protein